MNLYSYGNKKQCQLDKQEDALYVGEIEDYYLFIVADGNGGVVGGINTGQLAVNLVKNYLTKAINASTSIQDLYNHLDVAIYLASQAFLAVNAIDVKYESVYASLSVLLTSKGTYNTIYASTGNTEIQLIRDGEFKRVNQVFSETYEALMKGEVEEHDFYIHPGRGVVTSALGVFKEVNTDIFPMGNLKQNDIILLTTDGIYRYLNPDLVIQTLAEADSIENGVNDVLEKVNEEGGEDNATLIVVHIY